jgi:O-antigen ligase
MSIAHSMGEKLLTFGRTCRNVDPVALARVLIILEVVALLISTAATEVFEILIFLTIIGFGELRRRTFRALRQPMVMMALAVYCMVTIGIFYGVATFSESVDLWGSWRKMLLVPMVAAVYDDPAWKQRFLSVFISIAVIGALLSCAGYPLGIGNKFGPGILIHNWATQGMFFAVACFSCLVLLRFPLQSLFADKRLLAATAMILLLNIILITPGRSGYLALIVLIMVFIFFSLPRKTGLVLMVLAPVLIVSLLLVSPVSHEKLSKGIEELNTYEEDRVPTSMGLRLILWKNTITMLKRYENPLFGYGTAGFETAYADLMNEKETTGKRRWQDMPIHDPHNQYLGILFEYGIAGLLLFLLFIGSFFRQPAGKPYYILGIGVLLAWCATSLFSAHFTTSMEGRFLLIWCSAMLAADRRADVAVEEQPATKQARQDDLPGDLNRD